MRRLALVLLSSLTLTGANAEAESTRALLVPSRAVPLRVNAGEPLNLIVRVASGLTPPPGVQSERALRGFALRLCDAAESQTPRQEACRAVAVRNVRPVDAHSFVYRVEAPLPAAFAGGAYDVELRFPGGHAYVARGVLISASGAPGTLKDREAARSVPSLSGCSVEGETPGDAVRGLLLLALSWKLAAARLGRRRRWNSPRAPLVTERL
jgi:hypothetical protein